MNSALCLIYLYLCLIISNSGSVRQSVKYYVLNSISDDGKLDEPTPAVTFLRFHPNNSADPWRVYKKPSWESGKHSLTNEENPKQREKDILNGKVLRVARDPWVDQYLPDVFKALQQSGNFTMQFVEIFMDLRGYFDETRKTWTGAIAGLQKKRIDIAAYTYPIKTKLREVVDISQPILTAKPCLLIRKAPNTVSFARAGYLQPLSTQAWCGMLLLLFIAMGLLTVMKRKLVKKLHYGRNVPKQFLQLWGIFCQQGLSDFPRTSSLGIVYYAIFWFGLIVYSLYSSLLVSNLVGNQSNLPFSSMEEFAENKHYKLIVVRGTEFQRMINDPDNYDVYPYNIMRKKLMKDEDLPEFDWNFNEQICRDKVAGFIFNLFFEGDYEYYECSLALICSSSPRIDFSFAFQKNGPYTQALNYHILRLKDQGVIDSIYKRVIRDERNTLRRDEDVEVTYVGVTVSDISTLFSILLGSFVLPLIVLFFEKVHFWFYAKKTAVVPVVSRYCSAAARISPSGDLQQAQCRASTA